MLPIAIRFNLISHTGATNRNYSSSSNNNTRHSAVIWQQAKQPPYIARWQLLWIADQAQVAFEMNAMKKCIAMAVAATAERCVLAAMRLLTNPVWIYDKTIAAYQIIMQKIFENHNTRARICGQTNKRAYNLKHIRVYVPAALLCASCFALTLWLLWFNCFVYKCM